MKNSIITVISTVDCKNYGNKIILDIFESLMHVEIFDTYPTSYLIYNVSATYLNREL